MNTLFISIRVIKHVFVCVCLFVVISATFESYSLLREIPSCALSRRYRSQNITRKLSALSSSSRLDFVTLYLQAVTLSVFDTYLQLIAKRARHPRNCQGRPWSLTALKYVSANTRFFFVCFHCSPGRLDSNPMNCYSNPLRCAVAS